MRKKEYWIALTILLSPFTLFSEEENLQKKFEEIAKNEDAAIFIPPAGWRVVDPKQLPEEVKIMVIGYGKNEFPPSINLAFDPFSGTLDEYMKIVKAINGSQKNVWKDLGPIDLQNVKGRLIQVDSQTKWGMQRQLQLIVVKEGTAFILTAAALQNEYSSFYPDFFAAMKSFTISTKGSKEEDKKKLD